MNREQTKSIILLRATLPVIQLFGLKVVLNSPEKCVNITMIILNKAIMIGELMPESKRNIQTQFMLYFFPLQVPILHFLIVICI